MVYDFVGHLMLKFSTSVKHPAPETNQAGKKWDRIAHREIPVYLQLAEDLSEYQL